MTAEQRPQPTWSDDIHIGRVAAPLREQVLSVLRQAILDFQLKPGQRLVERELIEQLGVSRTTVREVLRELTAEGLVAVIPQKGAVVAKPSDEDAADLYEARAALEALAVRRFVERASDAKLAALDDVTVEIERLTGEGADTHEVLRAKDRFYEVLLDGAGSPSIKQILDGVQARVRILRATSLSESDRPVQAAAEIRAIVRAIGDRDADKAAELSAEHVRHAASVGLAALRKVAT
ncbi:GntR family transcriptional regulator [Tamaricihabitans halophyticus]|uniref:GntR family transcriptional regulator n=1 Tax=Tamaricihabitans halophyticus TaxID=1262583 RepID=A0A4V2SUX7_9PSEU|nr:GntR family transcriptional regulator [Tamaricihabitans halophyticus]TCP56396.1 GntR family transcriptional regulator [Tamaricihabitans halophyticus]